MEETPVVLGIPGGSSALSGQPRTPGVAGQEKQQGITAQAIPRPGDRHLLGSAISFRGIVVLHSGT